MEESLIAYLLADATFAGQAGTRAYWVRAPQGVAKPYATLQLISRMPDMTHGGASGLASSRVQVDCYGLTYGAAKALARAVTARLNGRKVTHAGTVFDGIFLDAERDFYDDDASPEKLHRVSLDFIIWHKGA